MIDDWVSRLREPRFGIALTTAVTGFAMSAHWPPLAIPSGLLVVLTVIRPRIALRPGVWLLNAGMWFSALALLPDRMEDHVFLFAVWLVAVWYSLSAEPDGFIDRAAWQARILIGATFATAVGWKLYFGEFASGRALWFYILLDRRFAPLAAVSGISDAAIEQGRAELAQLLAGSLESAALPVPSHAGGRLAVAALLTLLLEAVVAVSHLAPDRSRLSVLRIPSIVGFAAVTYALVPVVLFAMLLALLAMSAARWRYNVLWVLPVVVLVSVVRVATLQ